MIGRCDACYWWRGPRKNLLWSENYKAMGTCELSRVADSKKIHRNAKVLAWPNEYGHGVVYTAPDFGCVQFQAKEAPNA